MCVNGTHYSCRAELFRTVPPLCKRGISLYRKPKHCCIQHSHRPANISQQVYQRQKQVADAGSVGEVLQVGDRVWLYVPTVKQGQSEKFTLLRSTVINKTSPFICTIQLIGGNQNLTVHRNQFKLCYTDPALHRTPQMQQTTNDTPSTCSINGPKVGGYALRRGR